MNDNQNLLEKVCRNIYFNNKNELIFEDVVFDYANEFSRKNFNDNFIEAILNSINEKTELYKIARFLDILIWETPDNGKKLNYLTKNWIESADKTKILLTLFRQDDFPKGTEIENAESLHKVKQKYPELKKLCEYHIQEFKYWKKTGKRNIAELNNIIIEYTKRDYS